MLYAELDYPEHYSYCHEPLVELLEAHFDQVQSGLQGDSWIWIFDGDDKVALDSFSSMKHQLKSSAPNSRLIPKVLAVLQTRYSVKLIEPPELEAHEE
ncbi:hypothetical protein DV711_15220 [Motiliproteus coralliicola]|uniref:Uncharacterized protein n=1 Tax=Motiliproteus coralliicola TaxID=2283196 RepID=A0A369WBC3_9GAMM|nr:hypothetical protein [Motiliproteus coralliicola]RDE18957.1 hypothetical protein DV711_15220 [Motiliproteus coralliicola]